MPRIPVRTTPYHSLPRCTRHYKSKRDLILRALGKASFINGSQFVIAWISPKGEVDVYASELLQSAVQVKEGGILERRELEREAGRVRTEMGRRWEEVRLLEEKGEALVLEEEQDKEMDDEEDDIDEDGDRTLVDPILSTVTPAKQISNPSKSMMSTFPSTNPRSSTPSPPAHTITLAPEAVEPYYTARFAALQQATCKLVVKAWIKVIEPKKQVKYPYNKGEELKPDWWPQGVRHREPDHLSKSERLTLLASIVRSPLITVSRLELSTAEASAFISRPRLSILREVYLVAKEEERRRQAGDLDSDLIVHLPNTPISPSDVSPDSTSEKRTHSQMEVDILEKENFSSYANHSQKRMKHPNRLSALANSTQANYEAYSHAQQQPFSFAPQTHIFANPGPKDSSAPPPHHLSPYSATNEMSWSPAPNHHHHLAPLLNHQDSPTFPPTATMGGATYYPRGYQNAPSDYHQSNYDYGSPYLADNSWGETSPYASHQQ
ncbi:hypothetical protein P7C73_g2077, partial [Tremellales sp. Uapishka_1]